MRYITLDTPQIDYIAFTTFHDYGYNHQAEIGKLLDKMSDMKQEQSSFLQYIGKKWGGPAGTCFLGVGEQSSRTHYYGNISGELASDGDLLAIIFREIGEGRLRCSRLDIQTTIQMPDKWSQWALFNRYQKRKMPTGWHESRSRAGNTLRTVYIGNRQNGYFTRCYEKEIGGAVYLRLEYELKLGAARAYAKHLQSGQATPAQLFKLLLQKSGDATLERAFAWVVEHATDCGRPKAHEIRDSKTTEWLLESVLPAFTREINDHQSDGEVLRRFKQVIELAEKWGVDTLFDTV
jgi:hypothetical protein